MTRRLRVVKSILWGLVGVLGVVTAARFARGLGATTGLSDATPWGLWIAFDVLAGVALAAGGFVMAATVYIFGLERYRPFVRPAILTAFLGYLAVAIGLLYDLGLPWNIWHPMIYPQHHSVLFEVAMCVMLYLTVLGLEFAPVVLEHSWFGHPIFRAAHALLKKIGLALIIAGIILSTLHQSSLGSLFLIAPYRVHPLWYSPIIYVLFFISAVALGLAVVIMESLVSAWLLGHGIATRLLSKLGLTAAAVLGLYAAVRIGDLALRGILPAALDGSWQSNLFLAEIAICSILPAALLAVRRIRTSIPGLAVASAMVIFGMVLNRFSVSILAFARPTGISYFPTWIEVAVSVGIVAGGTLIFLFFVENLKVYSEEDKEHADAISSAAAVARASYDPAALGGLTPESLAAPRRYSLVAIAAASLAVGFLPKDAIFGPRPMRAPVRAARTVEAIEMNRGNGGNATRTDFLLSADGAGAPPAGKRVAVMIIDGNRNGRFVFFTHQGHVEKLGGEASCAECHHQNMPFDQDTACSECHRDMVGPTDTFSHASHVAHLNGNAGCVQCHADPSRVKSRQTATACIKCHADMPAAASFLGKSQATITGIAPGYMSAMHGVCIGCHENLVKEKPTEYSPAFARCDFCHGDSVNIDLRRLGPYAVLAKKLDSKTRPTR